MSIHTFDNGIQIYDHHILEPQRVRYSHCNVHEEDEEQAFIDTIQALPQGSCYASIGTAVGYYPLLARKLRPDLRICCLEPLPRHRQFFQDNISLNGYNAADFELYDLAVSTHDSQVTLVDQDYSSFLSAAAPISRARQLARRLLHRQPRQPRLQVEAIALANLFSRLNTPTIALAQMDIQGHEEAVLRAYFRTAAGSRQRVEWFLVGTHGDAIHSACARLLQANGYTLLIDDPDTQHQPDGILLARLHP
jgi:FkbM family methyltransferase